MPANMELRGRKRQLQKSHQRSARQRERLGATAFKPSEFSQLPQRIWTLDSCLESLHATARAELRRITRNEIQAAYVDGGWVPDEADHTFKARKNRVELVVAIDGNVATIVTVKYLAAHLTV